MSENYPLLHEWADLETEKRQIKARLDAIEKRMGEIKDAALEPFVTGELQGFKTKGLTLFVRRQLWAGVIRLDGETTAGPANERAAAALRAAGLGEFTGLKVEAQSLSAYVRELDERGEKLPPELEPYINVSTKIELSARKQ